MSTIEYFKNAGNRLAVEAGAIIFEQGEPGELMYAILEGEVELLVDGRVVGAIPEGGIFGEMALIDSGPRSATARAKTACTLAPIDEKRFTFMVQQTPFFAIKVMRIMSERLRRMNASH